MSRRSTVSLVSWASTRSSCAAATCCQRDELPYTLPLGIPMFDVSPAETLEQAASMLDYDAFRVWQREQFAVGRLLGVGIGLYIEPQSMIGPYSTEPAHLRVQPDGTVDVYLGSGSHGQGLETTTAQLVSEFLGVPFDDVTVHQGDTNETPYAFGTGGSRSGPILGAAIQGAAQVLRQQGDGDRRPPARGRARRHRRRRRRGERARHTDAIAHRRRDRARRVPRARQSAAGHGTGLGGPAPLHVRPAVRVLERVPLCTVEIDPHTGAVTLLRYIVSEDCGVMINPSVVEGQIAGGAVQGIGGALLEDFVYDEQGNPLTSTFMDYLLPTATDVPEIEYGHIETPASTPGHYKGVGEGGAIGAPAAVANAVNDALALVGAHVADGTVHARRASSKRSPQSAADDRFRRAACSVAVGQSRERGASEVDDVWGLRRSCALCDIEHDADVLGEQRRRDLPQTREVECGPGDDARGTAAAAAVREDLGHRGPVDAESCCEVKGLGRDGDLRGEEQVVEQLGHLAAPERPEMQHGIGVGGEDGPHPIHDRVVTADHHQQLALGGRDAAATHRCIDHVDPRSTAARSAAGGRCRDGRSRGSR